MVSFNYSFSETKCYPNPNSTGLTNRRPRSPHLSPEIHSFPELGEISLVSCYQRKPRQQSPAIPAD
jgi:hypothetical protein